MKMCFYSGFSGSFVNLMSLAQGFWQVAAAAAALLFAQNLRPIFQQ
jgi:hypothetical protein